MAQISYYILQVLMKFTQSNMLSINLIIISLCRYAVYLIDSSPEEQWSHILGMNRVCVNAKKLMLLAVLDSVCKRKFKYIETKRWIPEANRE